MEKESYDFLFKMVLIGDSSVGKTNILSKYLKGTFDESSKATVGVEFGTKNIKINDKKIKIQIWDTAGQERYRSITSAYYRGAKGAFIVYDITRQDTFDNIDKWVKDLKTNGDKNTVIMLIGNKSDLEDKRQVSTEEGQELADKYGMLFFETSAKNGQNVEEIFQNSANEIARKIDQGFYDLENDTCGIKQGINRQGAGGDQRIGLDNNQGKKSGGGCC